MRVILGTSSVCMFILCGFVILPRTERSVQYVSNFENVLGTSLELRITTTSEKVVSETEEAVLNEIDRLSKILSGYDQDSEFSRWLKTKDEAIVVSEELFDVLSLFDVWRARTQGALDASAESISKVWKKAEERQQLPTDAELKNAIATVKQRHWRLDAERRTATHLTDAPLLLNSFTKSYIIHRACEVALASGNVKSVVVNIGGDIVVRGNHSEGVEITDPRASTQNDISLEYLKISNKAVATSGNYRRGVKIGEQWYSHIVDPRTGEPVDHIISATVVAPLATDAGALATAFNVLTPLEAGKLAASIPNVEYLLVTKEGDRIESKGWSLFKDEQRSHIEQLDSGISKWDDFELVVDVELTRINVSWYKRPFVAIWIENEEKQSVKNLAVWVGNTRWISELRYWYRTNWTKANLPDSKIGSVASATHAPGKYTFKWDGRDDDGNLLKPGKYTVLVESARELGPYLLLKQEMELMGTPKQVTMLGTGENPSVYSVTIDYHKKP